MVCPRSTSARRSCGTSLNKGDALHAVLSFNPLSSNLWSSSLSCIPRDHVNSHIECQLVIIFIQNQYKLSFEVAKHVNHICVPTYIVWTTRDRHPNEHFFLFLIVPPYIFPRTCLWRGDLVMHTFTFADIARIELASL